MRLTDTHCHLNFHDYHKDLKEVLIRSMAAGVERILVPATDLASSREISLLIQEDEMLYGAVGVHPNSGLSWSDNTLSGLKELTPHPGIVAVGEIGLDYFRDHTPREIQTQILKEQLKLASDVGLPVVLHVRNQSEADRQCMTDLLGILEEWSGGRGDRLKTPPGVIHSFSGNVEDSNRAQEMGFFIGITGPVTYKKADGMREVVKAMDLSRLLIETDGPFLSPQQMRGKRNEPAHVSYIIDKISEITGLAPEKLAEQTTKNAARLFMWE